MNHKNKYFHNSLYLKNILDLNILAYFLFVIPKKMSSDSKSW